LKPKRALQRTPPKAKNYSPIKDAKSGTGGVVSRDHHESGSKTHGAGPVQRTPPRKHNEKLNRSALKDDPRNNSGIYDYSNVDKNTITIQRKDKIQRSPVDPMRNIQQLEVPPPKISEKQFSSPINLNEMNRGMDYSGSPDFAEGNLYEQFSPIKHNFYPRSPQTFQNTRDTSELNNFEDRVDDLLCETRNKLDVFTPKSDYAAQKDSFPGQVGYYNMPQPQMYPQNEGPSDKYHNDQMPGIMIPQNIMPQTMMPQMYNQGPVPMPYYGPMPMNQNMMGLQPMMYPPQGYSGHMSPDNVAQMGYSPQMMPQSQIPMGAQPFYPMYYPQPNYPNQPGQSHSQY
jgi:hypothetical protein